MGGEIAVSIPQRTRSNTLWNKKQRILANAIKRARYIALLPYTDLH